MSCASWLTRCCARTGRSGTWPGCLAPEHRRGHGALYDAVNHGRVDISRLHRTRGGCDDHHRGEPDRDIGRVAVQGPRPPYPRTVKALDKPGDQIGRLFSEPTELLVLRHCHQVTTAVVVVMDTYAHDLRNPRSYMMIDGADTSRILKSLGLLPASPSR
jgi:hypothetical protein